MHPTRLSRAARRHPPLWPVIVLLLVVTPLGACAPEQETQDEAQEPNDQLGEAGRAVGEKLAEAGRQAEDYARELGEDVEPHARDAAITAKVTAKLAADPQVNPFFIDVDTIDGEVTLSGKVPSEEIRSEVEELARDTEGVLAVTNRLEIGQRGGS